MPTVEGSSESILDERYLFIVTFLYKFFSIKQMILDEEEEINCTNSPFKSVINNIFSDALVMNDMSNR